MRHEENSKKERRKHNRYLQSDGHEDRVIPFAGRTEHELFDLPSVRVSE